ncbi:MAG: esterase-like activity of phytase family protein [Opitutales bacterium]|nr:esterase-like activity of phytase family protein [Opitutales bacterium]
MNLPAYLFACGAMHWALPAFQFAPLAALRDRTPQAALLLAFLATATHSPLSAEPLELTLLGETELVTGTMIDGVPVRDLSGITYDPRTNTFLAVNDSAGFGAARIFEILLDYDASGITAVAPLGSHLLRDEGGQPLPDIDAEGLALGPDGKLYVSTEGRAGASLPASRDPAIWVFNEVTLQRLTALPLPEMFLPLNADGHPTSPGATNQASGVRSNLGLEALTVTSTGNTLFAANEAALLQDDSRPPFDATFNQAHNSDSRIVRFERDALGNWSVTGQRVYRAEAGTLYLFIVRRFNTVSSILSIDDNGRLLVLERGLRANNLNTGSYLIRLFEVDFNEAEATEVMHEASLLQIPSPTVLRGLTKRLVWQGDSALDNLEGMTWGRPVDGFRSLVLVSDNNNSPNQTTQFLVFRTNIPVLPDTPFLEWLRGYFSEAELLAEGLDDPLRSAFNDRVPNLLKYALGLPPDEPANSIAPMNFHVETANGIGATARLRIPDPPPPGIRYYIEWSDRLDKWFSMDLDELQDPVELPAEEGWRELAIRLPANGPGPRPVYARLRVEEQ